MQNGKRTIAYYDADARLVGTTYKLSFADLLVSAQKKINRQYKGYKILETIFFDDNEANESDFYLNNTRFNDMDTYFVILQKNSKKIIIQVSMNGEIAFFGAV